MPTTTTNLALNKTDTTSDGQGSFVDKNEYFNFDTDLNDNWDIIDSATGKLSDLTSIEKGSLVGAINEVIGSIPDVSAKLDKSGDKMTGTLEFDKDVSGINIPVSPSPEPCVWGRFDHVVGDADPASNIYALGRIVTDNGTTPKILGREYWRFGSSGNTALVQQVYSYDNNDNLVNASTSLVVAPDGTTSFSFPMCDTKATTTSSASSNKVAVVTKNYVNGTSWYRVWSDGWIEQGGYLSVTSSSATVNLLKSHANTNYNITLGSYQPAVGAGYAVVTSQAKNSFVLDCSGLGSLSMWWRTAGY